MDLYPASMDLPFLSHPFTAIGYLDPCKVYGYHSWLITGRYCIGKVERQLGSASPDIGIVGRSNLRNKFRELSQEAF